MAVKRLYRGWGGSGWPASAVAVAFAASARVSQQVDPPHIVYQHTAGPAERKQPRHRDDRRQHPPSIRENEVAVADGRVRVAGEEARRSPVRDEVRIDERHRPQQHLDRVQRHQHEDDASHQQVRAPVGRALHDGVRPSRDVRRHRPHAGGVHEDDENKHRAAEEKVGRRHELGQVLEHRQLLEVRCAALERSWNLLERVGRRRGHRGGKEDGRGVHGGRGWYARQDSNLLPPA